MKFLKGFGKIVGSKPAASSAAQAIGRQAAADRRALQAGTKYVDIGTPPRNFNASNYLPKNAK